MHQTIQLTIIGAAAGALYSLMASGLVLTYRSSKVINFAQGALATFGTFTFLHASNEWGWPLVPAMLVGIAASTAIGALFQLIVLRQLRLAAPLARLVATLGLFIAVNASIIPLFDTERPPRVRIFSSDAVTVPIGSPRFFLPFDRVAVCLLTVGVLLGLSAVYRYTRFGRATRAGADNQLATALLALSPNRLELLNWALGAALAAIAGILLSAITQPDAISYTLVMVAALAVALVAQFRSFSVLLVAGLALGAGQALLARYASELQDWTGLVGWGQALPLLVIILAIVLRGRTVERKGAFDERPLPAAGVSRRPWRWGLVCLVVGTAWMMLAPRGAITPTTVTLVGVVMALSLVVVTGYAGQISLVQYGLAGFGAFAAARLAADAGVPFPLPVLLGGICAVPLGVLIGLPALRVRGLQLGIVTLGAAIVLDVMFFADRRWTGGESGLEIPEAEIGSLSLSGIGEPRRYAVFVLVVTILVGLGVAYLRRSKLGSQLLACRSNERGAAAAGLSVPRLKQLAFGLGAFVAGIGGALQAYRSTQISWAGFDFMSSILLVSIAYMGGIALVSGAAVAGVIASSGIVAYYLHFEGSAARVYEVIGGLGVMFVVIVHPDGLATIPRDIRHHLHARRSQPVSTAEPPPPVSSAPEGAAEPTEAVAR